MKKILTTIMCIMLVLAFTACGGEDKAPVEPGNISLSLSTAENDVEYMQASALSVFGLEKAENCTLTLDFTNSGSTEEGFIVSGTGTLNLNGEEYDFNIEDQALLCIEVSEENTVYSGILDSALGMETGDTQEISIDFTANRDFSQAVATVSADGGYLFFGDVFDDYLEYFNMVLTQIADE
ncbi:MAG: hypothetical protein ACI4LP_02565 [Anaerovoracaceae bacterium]